jgi:hypothetical protein
MAKIVKDNFSRITSAQLTVPVTKDTYYSELFTDKYEADAEIAFVVHEASFQVNEIEAMIATAGTKLQFGLSFMEVIEAPIDYDSYGILYMEEYRRSNSDAPGTAIQTDITKNIFVKDFTGLPGGGLLVHPAVLSLFANVLVADLDNAGVITAIIRYSELPIDNNTYTSLFKAQWARVR